MPQNHVKYLAMVARGAASVKANQLQTTAKRGRPNALLGRFGGPGGPSHHWTPRWMDAGDARADLGGCAGTEGDHASPIWVGGTGYRSRSDERDGRCDLDGRRCASSFPEGWLDD